MDRDEIIGSKEKVTKEFREKEGVLKNSAYDDSSIKVLKGLEPIRERPGMFIGSTGVEGLHHLIWEALDNAVDEAVAGYATKIKLVIEEGQVISVEDNGRGIPTGINSDTGLSTIVTIFTVLHAGGKFDNASYKTSGGLHGVGIKCVNALSTFLEVSVKREGNLHFTRFVDGGKLERGPEISDLAELNTGTKIRWKPDFSILDENKYDLDLIKERLQRLSYLNKNILFEFEHQPTEEKEVFFSERGLADWVEQLRVDPDAKKVDSDPEKDILLVPVHELQNILIVDKEVSKKGNKESLRLELSFQYVDGRDKPLIYSFCNNIFTPQGGAHLEAVKDGILNCVREKLFFHKLIKHPTDLIKDDVVNGLNLVLSLHYTSPDYKGQTKEALANTEIRPHIRIEVDQWLHHFFEENVNAMNSILTHINNARERRINRENANQIGRELQKKNIFDFASKLADCTFKSKDFSELYIVEGDSAGGSAKSARNREFQAILPIKGKLMNVLKNKNFSRNEEVGSLVTAIGCFDKNSEDKVNLENLKYNKIILMTDADVDGAHIRVLLLTFLYTEGVSLIKAGHVYIAQPPLYRAQSKKETLYLFDERAKDKFEKERNKNSSFEINRFKGLGEMSPQQLWETTMDPKKRVLLQVTIEDGEEATAVIKKLMGNDVKPRKKFIVENYDRATLDV